MDANEAAELLRGREDRWLDAYYGGFDPTGVDEIDLILSAVAKAGKSYHSTAQWDEDMFYSQPRGPSCWEVIQMMANDAAEKIRAEREGRGA